MVDANQYHNLEDNMNANELADEVMEHYRAMLPRGFNVNWMQEAATMLRQQQAEIEALKQIIDANNLNQNIGQFVKPTNEPVAWMEIEEGGITEYKVWREPISSKSIPLYTHPVKELTDEEINKVWYEDCSHRHDSLIEFARAILRKAQEK